MSPRLKLHLVVLVSVLVGLVLQTTLVSRMAWPAGLTPDLLVLVVSAVGLATSPNYGAFTGFFAGLLADIMPPDVSTIGTTAFAFALVGYLAGGVRDPRGLARIQLLGILMGLAMLSGVIQLAFAWVLADRAVDPAYALLTTTGSALFTALVGVVTVPYLVRVLRRLDRRDGRVEPVAVQTPIGTRN